LVSRAGLEPGRLIENAQVIDSTKKQKRQNRYSRRFEVHSGYTDEAFKVRADDPPRHQVKRGLENATAQLTIQNTAMVTRHVTLTDTDKIREIKQTYCDTFEKNVRVGVLLHELRLSKKHWNDYGLPFTYSWSRRLIKIAKDRRMAANRDIMPGGRAVLHKIACLRDLEFADAIRPNPALDGLAIIHPAVTREDIEDWLRYRD